MGGGVCGGGGVKQLGVATHNLRGIDQCHIQGFSQCLLCLEVTGVNISKYNRKDED